MGSQARVRWGWPLGMHLLAFLSSVPAVAAARGAGDLWIGPPGVYGDKVWFPDEVAPLADAVAELLARPKLGGYRVRPNAELRVFWADVQAGRLPGVAAVCETPPPPAFLAGSVYRGASAADVRVDCPDSGPCALEVVVASPRPTPEDPRNVEETARFAAKLPRGETPAQWADRLRKSGLRRVRPPKLTGGLGLSGIVDPDAKNPAPVRVRVFDVRLTGDWPTPLSAATFGPQTAALAACTKPGQMWRDHWHQPYLVEVDASGAVQRCEHEIADHLPTPEFPCVCGVLRGMRLEPAPAPRRARFSLDVVRPEPRLRFRAYVGDERGTDLTATLGSRAVDDQALSACLSPLPAPIAHTEAPVHFAVGADGRVIRHRVQWPPAIPDKVRGCLDGVLATGRFTCPLSGASEIDARLHVYTLNPR